MKGQPRLTTIQSLTVYLGALIFKLSRPGSFRINETTLTTLLKRSRENIAMIRRHHNGQYNSSITAVEALAFCLSRILSQVRSTFGAKRRYFEIRMAAKNTPGPTLACPSLGLTPQCSHIKTTIARLSRKTFLAVFQRLALQACLEFTVNFMMAKFNGI